MFGKVTATQRALEHCGFCSPLLLHIDYGSGAPSFYLVTRGVAIPISRERFVAEYNLKPTLTASETGLEFAWR